LICVNQKRAIAKIYKIELDIGSYGKNDRSRQNRSKLTIHLSKFAIQNDFIQNEPFFTILNE